MANQFPAFITYLTTTSTSFSLPPLCSLTPFTTHPSAPRRLATSLLLRNLAFAHPRPLILLRDPISLLPHLLLPLLGSDPPFTEDEQDQLLPELQYLGPDQVREKDVEVIQQLLEALYLLVVRGDKFGDEPDEGRGGQRAVKEAGTYLVVRELHKDVEDDGVREGCERLVDVLIAIEHAEGKGVTDVVDEEHSGGREDDDEEDKIVEIF